MDHISQFVSNLHINNKLEKEKKVSKIRFQPNHML